MMDVVLPSGKRILNVPEGTSKEAIKEKAIQSGKFTEEDFINPDKSADAVKLDSESKVSSQEVQTADARDADKNILSENTLLYGGLGLALILFIFLGRQVIKRKQAVIRITIFLSLILVAIGYAEGIPLYVPVLLFWGLVWVFDAIVKRD
jgi:hypothetical protein